MHRNPNYVSRFQRHNVTRLIKRQMMIHEIAEVKAIFITCHSIDDGYYVMKVVTNVPFPHESERIEFMHDFLNDMMIGQRGLLTENEQAVFITQYTQSYFIHTSKGVRYTKYNDNYYLPSPGKKVSSFLKNDIERVFREAIEIAEVGGFETRSIIGQIKLSYETNVFETIKERLDRRIIGGRPIFRDFYMMRHSCESKVKSNLGFILRTKYRVGRAVVKSSIKKKIFDWCNRAKRNVKKRRDDIENKLDYQRYRAEKRRRRRQNKRRRLDVYGDPLGKIKNINNADTGKKIKSWSYRKKWVQQKKHLHVMKRSFNYGFITFTKPWLYSSDVIFKDEYLGPQDRSMSELIIILNSIPKHLKPMMDVNDYKNYINQGIESLGDVKVKYLKVINNI